MLRSLSLSASGLLFVATAAAAQEIRGVIMDVTTEERLASAVVMLLDGDGVLHESVLSDTAGAFAFVIPRTDSLRVRVPRYGYATVQSVSVRLSRRDSLRLEIRLRPSPIPIPGVTATGDLVRSRNLEGFLVRQRAGYGKYLGPGDIARLRPRNTTILLAAVPGSPIVTGGSALGIVARSRDARSESGLLRGTCVPTVYVDGLELRGEPASNPQWADLDRIRAPHTREPGVRVESVVAARTVRAVEVYQRPAHAPLEFQRPLMAECPVILIWTDFGFGLARTR